MFHVKQLSEENVRKSKTTIFFIFIVILSMIFSGCGNTILKVEKNDIHNNNIESSTSNKIETNKNIDKIKIPYYENDTLNPYKSETLHNFILNTLIYDSLFILDTADNPIPLIAISITKLQDGHLIAIDTEQKFSDGSSITVDDVLYSFNLAREHKYYGPPLNNIDNIEKISENTFKVYLKEPDVYFSKCLTFPIVKQSSSKELPIGSGRFVLDSTQKKLIASTTTHRKVKTIKEIELVPTVNEETLSFALMDNSIDVMYSDLQSKFNLGVGIGYKQIPISNLIYLGVNPYVVNDDIRKLISMNIDREMISRTAYTGFAKPTFFPIKTDNYNKDIYNLFNLEEALLKQGYRKNENNRWIFNDKYVTIDILINKESLDKTVIGEYLQKTLTNMGFESTLRKVSYNEYINNINNGNYGIYVAEMKLSPNNDLTQLLSNKNIDYSTFYPNIINSYREMKSIKDNEEQFKLTFTEELPVIPLVFRRGALCYSRDFSANIVATEQDIFYNIENW